MTDEDRERELMMAWEVMAGGEPEMTDEDRAMQAEWETMLGSPGNEPKHDRTTRVLNQDEVDSLLGFDASEDERAPADGQLSATGWICPVCGAGIRPDIEKCIHRGGGE